MARATSTGIKLLVCLALLGVDGPVVERRTWINDGSTVFPIGNRDVDVSDDTPHWTFRDSDDNVAYQWHLDTASSSIPWQHLTLWRGTLTANGATFAVNPDTP